MLDESRRDQVCLHNGLLVAVNSDLDEIRDYEPKDPVAGTVAPGPVLFRGALKNNRGRETRGMMSGTASVFKRGCELVLMPCLKPPAPAQLSSKGKRQDARRTHMR
jgi:hypothetical protein